MRRVALIAAVVAALAPLSLLAVALAGCASSEPSASTPAGQKQIAGEAKTDAAQATKEGRPCEAAKLEESSSQYASECEAQKNHEAKATEASQETEAVREGLRLKEEGKIE